MLELFEARIGPVRRRAEAVGRTLIGRHVWDAQKLAARSKCLVRVVRRDGTGLIVTADFVPNRIDVATEDNVVVEASPGGTAKVRQG